MTDLTFLHDLTKAGKMTPVIDKRHHKRSP
jgi:hypothetical protein